MTRVLVWLANGFVVAALALLASEHARLVLLLWLDRPAPVEAPALARPGARTPSRSERSGAAILARNPFDSRWPGLRAAEPSLADLEACESLRVSIVSESRDSTWSLASLSTSGRAPARLVRAGEVFEGREIVHVGWDPWLASPAVWMRQRGVLCRAALFGALPPRAPSGPTTGPSDASWVVPAALRRGIRARDGRVEVDGGAFEALLGAFDRYVGPVRIVKPRSAEPGVELLGIRPGSVLGLLGLESGDVVRAVNGHDVSTPSSVLVAHRELASARSFVIAFTRDGAQRTLHVDVR